MEDSSENGTRSNVLSHTRKDALCGTPNGAHLDTHADEGSDASVVKPWHGLPQRESRHRATARPRAIIDRWPERDEWIVTCVHLGLSARQIAELSMAWPQPMRAVRQVYDKLKSLGLRGAYARAGRKRATVHSRQINEAFIRLVRLAFVHGHEVGDVFRGSSPHEGARVKPDLGLVIGNRQFYVEVQLSRLQFAKWADKQRRYLHTYRMTGRPFRTLFLIKTGDLDFVRRHARSVLKDHPKLNLFYFLNWDEFLEGDAVAGKIWLGAWNDKKQSLL